MAVTRHATGHSAPRKQPASSSLTTALFGSKPKSKKPATTSTTTTTTTTKTTKTTGAATANTSKPRTKSDGVLGGRVGKNTKAKGKGTGGGEEGLKRRPRKTGIKDKVQGLLEKAVGTVEGKPGKKGAGTKKIRGTDGKGVTKGR